MKKSILLLIIFILSISTTMAQVPETIISEEGSAWYIQLFSQQAVFGGGFEVDTTVNKGELISAKPLVKYLHDSEKSKYVIFFRQQGKPDVLFKTVYTTVPHKEGDKVAVVIKNIDTGKIHDSWCNGYVTLYIKHYSFYDGTYHKENPIEGGFSSYILLDCGGTCERKYDGIADNGIVLGNFCKSDDVYQKYQTNDCQILETLRERCLGTGCSGGECGQALVCTEGYYGSKFCKENAVYQRFGTGIIDGVCGNEDKLQFECPEDRTCASATCVKKEICGNDVCSGDETPTSCSQDCGLPFRCGDGVCNGDEDETSCSNDCEHLFNPKQCETDTDCENDASLQCLDGEAWSHQHSCINNYCNIQNDEPPKGCLTEKVKESNVIWWIIGVLVVVIMIVLVWFFGFRKY